MTFLRSMHNVGLYVSGAYPLAASYIVITCALNRHVYADMYDAGLQTPWTDNVDVWQATLKKPDHCFVGKCWISMFRMKA